MAQCFFPCPELNVNPPEFVTSYDSTDLLISELKELAWNPFSDVSKETSTEKKNDSHMSPSIERRKKLEKRMLTKTSKLEAKSLLKELKDLQLGLQKDLKEIVNLTEEMTWKEERH